MRPPRAVVVYSAVFGPAAVASILLSLGELVPEWVAVALLFPGAFLVTSLVYQVARARSDDPEYRRICRTASLPPLAAALLGTLLLAAILLL
ncbi:MAG: hypothetical protein EA352_02705 [Gemmatimonadales bacterium]|nr:MAG: hypothetical protein EA352_02705 [Gemmatimonadales bacterium]